MALSATRIRRVEFRATQIRVTNTRAVRRAMVKVGKELRRHLQKKLDRPYPPASRPGTAPKRRTGGLQKSVDVVVTGRRMYVRSRQYGFWLHGGTRRIRPRPWLPSGAQFKRTWIPKINRHAKRYAAETVPTG